MHKGKWNMLCQNITIIALIGKCDSSRMFAFIEKIILFVLFSSNPFNMCIQSLEFNIMSFGPVESYVWTVPGCSLERAEHALKHCGLWPIVFWQRLFIMSGEIFHCPRWVRFLFYFIGTCRISLDFGLMPFSLIFYWKLDFFL